MRPVYVDLPAEDRDEADPIDTCGELAYSMYGTRDAAQNWAEEYSSKLIAAGFIRGIANPCLFRHGKKDISLTVHGDDFVAVGTNDELMEVKAMLLDAYKITYEVLGPGDGEVREVRILNRIIRWTDAGIKMEADPRHAEKVIAHYDLDDARATKMPGVKPAKKEEEKEGVDDPDEEELPTKEATEHRGIAARLNYLVGDRADIQFATKELARTMAKPKRGDVAKAKRIARYLRGRPRVVLNYDWCGPEAEMKGYSDSDWAGCASSRRSTSGGVMMIGSHLIKSYSRQQRTIALSSAEAELHALVAASSEALGLVAYAADLGFALKPIIYTDASAALGIAQRRGLGKLRHVQTQALWVQQLNCEKRLGFKKVLGTENPSDLLTKHLPSETLEKHMSAMRATFEVGRAASAPGVSSVENASDSYLGTRMDQWHRDGKVKCWVKEMEEEEIRSLASVEGGVREPKSPGDQRRQVKFNDAVKRYYVPAYSVVYGRHPRTFHFDAMGFMVDAKHDDNGQALIHRPAAQDLPQHRGDVDRSQGGAQRDGLPGGDTGRYD